MVQFCTNPRRLGFVFIKAVLLLLGDFRMVERTRAKQPSLARGNERLCMVAASHCNSSHRTPLPGLGESLHSLPQASTEQRLATSVCKSCLIAHLNLAPWTAADAAQDQACGVERHGSPKDSTISCDSSGAPSDTTTANRSRAKANASTAEATPTRAFHIL